MKDSFEMPRYMKIAVDIATRIYNGYICEGEKLRGRSILAGEYNVSPETIRKAMKLLEDKGVVDVNKGSGIIVRSVEQAHEFIKSSREKESLSSLKATMKNLIQDRNNLEKKIQDINEKIIDNAYRFRNIDLIDVIEIQIKQESPIVGKTIGDIEFWKNTGATIIGVKRDDDIIISPGPYLEFKKEDKILVVGNEGVEEKIQKFLSSKDM